jgi:hypothetical protein
MYDSMFGDKDSIAAAQAMPWGSGIAGLPDDYKKLQAYGEGMFGVTAGAGKFYNKASGNFGNEYDLGATD